MSDKHGKWVSNAVGEPNIGTVFCRSLGHGVYETPQQALERHLKWRSQFVVGEPRAITTGSSCESTSKRAVRWCAAGAISRCSGVDDGDWSNTDAVSPINLLWLYLGGNKPIGDWNDDPSRTQAEVVAALRAAAEKAP
jgi:hypothetical protein